MSRLQSETIGADRRCMTLSKHAVAAPLLALTLLVALPSPARADATVFLGGSRNPTSNRISGAAFGLGLLVVGFEVEGALHRESVSDGVPGLKTGMANVLVQTPTGAIQLYGTLGGGLYQETIGAANKTNVGTNIGGGLKIGLAGPLRIRVDFRVLHLNGTPKNATTQRFYVGANLKF